MDLSRNYNKTLCLISLFTLTFIIYGFSLPFSFQTPHFSSQTDFPSHANFVYRFMQTFKSGQFVPRTVIDSLGFAGNAADAPTFQYYGFLEGAIALPFQLLGISSTNAIVLSCILARFLSLVVLFQTCLVLGTTRATAFLSCVSLLISPYTLTVFYGRGAIAETVAQCALTLIPYGYALAYKNRISSAILAFALAFFFLPLAHNIILLYGLLLVALLTFFCLQVNVIKAAVLGTGLGLLLSAWQWFPAFTTLHEIVLLGQLDAWQIISNFVSWSGAKGFPAQYIYPVTSQPLPIYFTIGWWTIPCIGFAVLGFFNKGKRRIAFAFVMTSVIFIALTFPPFSDKMFQYLPQMFKVTQFSYRLLGFVSLLGAVCLAIGLPNIKSYRVLIIVLSLMLLSQLSLLSCYFNLASKESLPNEKIQDRSINYYYSNPDKSFFGINVSNITSPFNINDSFVFSSQIYNRFFISLIGSVSGPENVPIKIAIASVSKDAQTNLYKINSIVSKPFKITTGSSFSGIFETLSKLPSGDYKLVLLNEDESLKNKITVTLNHIDLIPENLSSYVSSAYLELKKKSGYHRKYVVLNKTQFNPDANGNYLVELPIIYSKFFAVSQNGKQLESHPDFDHQILVRTQDLTSVIDVSYQLDYFPLLLFLIGVTYLFFLIFRIFSMKKSFMTSDIN